jgi:short-subunit dehydrogenase
VIGIPRRRRVGGQVVLITGASSGIGAATAVECAGRGAALALCARREDRLEQIARRCVAAGAPRVHAGTVDIGSPGQARSFALEAEQIVGPIDVLVNNAGSGWTGPFWQMPEEDIERVVSTNLVGVARMTRAVLPGMLQRGRGTVVMVASVVGISTLPYSTVYCASKQAMIGLAQALRAELRGSSVAVRIVYPSGTETEFHRHAPLTTGGPMASAAVVASDVVRAIELPGDVIAPRWRYRALTAPLMGSRRRRRATAALREVDPSLVPNS